jgi:hypothetical protein
LRARTCAAGARQWRRTPTSSRGLPRLSSPIPTVLLAVSDLFNGHRALNASR